jgi:hypothetical protein
MIEYRAAMVTDVGNIAIALMVDHRLVRRPILEIVETDKCHIFRLWHPTDTLR